MLYARQCPRHFRSKGHIKVLRNKEKMYIYIIFYFYFNGSFGEGHSGVGLIMDKMSCFGRLHSKKKDLNAFLSSWYIIWHRFISLLGTITFIFWLYKNYDFCWSLDNGYCHSQITWTGFKHAKCAHWNWLFHVMKLSSCSCCSELNEIKII